MGNISNNILAIIVVYYMSAFAYGFHSGSQSFVNGDSVFSSAVKYVNMIPIAKQGFKVGYQTAIRFN